MGVLELQNIPEVSFGANTLGSNVWAAVSFRHHPCICSTTVLHDIYIHIYIRVLFGINFFGGNLHIYLYVRMYIHTCVVWRKHDVVYQ